MPFLNVNPNFIGGIIIKINPRRNKGYVSNLNTIISFLPYLCGLKF